MQALCDGSHLLWCPSSVHGLKKTTIKKKSAKPLKALLIGSGKVLEINKNSSGSPNRVGGLNHQFEFVALVLNGNVVAVNCAGEATLG